MNLLKNTTLLLVLFFCLHLNAQSNLNTRIENAFATIDSAPKKTYEELLKLKSADGLKDTLKVKLHLYLANYHNKFNTSDSAVYYANKVLTATTNKKKIAGANRVIGSSYSRNGQREAALKSLSISLEIAKEINDQQLICTVYSDLGHLYFFKGDHDKALTFFEESLNTAQNDKDINRIEVNIGNVYYRKLDFEKAKTYFLKGLKALEKQKNPYFETSVHINLGVIAIQEKEYKKAQEYLEKAQKLSKENNFQPFLIVTTYNLGYIKDVIGNYRGAIKIYDKALAVAMANSNLEYQKVIYNSLADAYTKIEDYKNANLLLQKHYQLQDSLKKNAYDKELNKLGITLETTQKENEITRQKAEIQHQKVIKQGAVASGSILLIFAILLIVFYYQKLRAQVSLNASEKEIRKKEVEALKKEQELRLIIAATVAEDKERERIARKLHDSIGSNLAGIALQLNDADMNTTKIDVLKRYLNETYELVRDMSHSLIPKSFKNHVFTEYLDDYLNRNAKNAKLSLTFNAHPAGIINTLPETIQYELFQIIQELFTNCLKHAKASQLDVHLSIQENIVKLLIEDNGVGFDQTLIQKGIGLKNIQSRLENLSGKLHIDTVIGRGTIIDIDIPVSFAVSELNSSSTK